MKKRPRLRIRGGRAPLWAVVLGEGRVVRKMGSMLATGKMLELVTDVMVEWRMSFAGLGRFSVQLILCE